MFFFVLACSTPEPSTAVAPAETLTVEAVQPAPSNADLEAVALTSSDQRARGEAIVELVARGTGRDVFAQIQADESAPEILRIWAAAARIQLADEAELDEVSKLTNTWPELERPVRLRRAELDGTG